MRYGGPWLLSEVGSKPTCSHKECELGGEGETLPNRYGDTPCDVSDEIEEKSESESESDWQPAHEDSGSE